MEQVDYLQRDAGLDMSEALAEKRAFFAELSEKHTYDEIVEALEDAHYRWGGDHCGYDDVVDND